MEFLSLEDYPCLQEHVNKLYGEGIPTLKVRGDFLEKELGLVMVSTENCLVVGFILLSPSKSKHGTSISVERFKVLEECRSEGWDRMLLLEAEKRARELGHTEIIVEASLCTGTIFQDLGYSSKKDTSGKTLRKRLLLQRSPIHPQPLALLQQLCYKLTMVEEKNTVNNAKDVTLLIVPWIQQLSGAACMSGLICCNMASMFIVQPRAVKCKLKKDRKKRFSLDSWNLCNLKTWKMDRKISNNGRFDRDSRYSKKKKEKSLIAARTEDGSTQHTSFLSVRSRSNSFDHSDLQYASGSIPRKASAELFRRATFDIASHQGKTTDYIKISSPTEMDLGLSTNGMDLIATRSASSSPTYEQSIISPGSCAFSYSYDETVVVGPPVENDCGIPRSRGYSQPMNKKNSAVARNPGFTSVPSITLAPPETFWMTPAPSREGQNVEPTTVLFPTGDYAADQHLFAKHPIPAAGYSSSTTAQPFSQTTKNLRVRTPEAKQSRSSENRWRDSKYCATDTMGNFRELFKIERKRQSSRHKRTSSFPFIELDGKVDVFQEGEAETGVTGPAAPLGDTADLQKRLSAFTDHSSELQKGQAHPRFLRGPSLKNVPQISEHSELLNILPALVEAERALEFGFLETKTQSSPSKFKKSRELLQSLLRELREVLPKASQRERVITRASCGRTLMENKRILKSQLGEQIDSRSLAKLYSKQELGLHVTTMSFDTDLIRHYVADKFMPVCVPYRDLVLLSDSASNTTGGHKSSRGSRLYMLIVGIVEDSYRQYLHGTQMVFIVMFPRTEGLHLCTEKDLLDARANLSETSLREVSSKEMLVFSLS